MNFSPKTEEELQSALLLPKGEYLFCVKGAENAVSKRGNEMIKLSISTWDNDAKEYFLYDYLLESMPGKLKHFCDAVGLENLYSKGALSAHDCVNKEGVLLIDVEGGQLRPEGGNYPPKNVIKDYIKMRDEKKPVATKSSDFSGFDDDIPNF